MKIMAATLKCQHPKQTMVLEMWVIGSQVALEIEMIVTTCLSTTDHKISNRINISDKGGLGCEEQRHS